MNQEILTTDVLIVGAGPTGLTLANVLGQAGVDVIIIDRKPSTVAEPRAVSIDDESLRTMQAIGLADEVLRNVVAGYGVHYFTKPGGRCFGKVEPSASNYGFPRRNAFRQPLFEASLREGLQRFPSVRVLFDHDLKTFTNGLDNVSSIVSRNNGEQITIVSRYMAGCDGGRSPIREALGIVLAGSTFKSRWLVLDTEEDDDPFWQTRVYCDSERPVVDVPGPHHTRRYEILIHPHEDADQAMSPERIRELLWPFRGDRPTKIVRKVVYTFHARMAEKWRSGRVFLAGDAAHLTPPYAGQGMNSGVRDAHNLGWKLASVIKGRMAEKTLDSYEEERRAHAWALIKLALNLGEVMAPRSRLHASAFHAFFTLTGYIPPIRDYFLQMKFKPKPKYASGLLGPEIQTGKGDIRGTMFPQPKVAYDSRQNVLLDEVIGHRFALIRRGNLAPNLAWKLRHPLWERLNAAHIVVHPGFQASSAQESSSQLEEKVVLDTEGALTELFNDAKCDVILVRPDRYIAGTFSFGQEEAFASSFADKIGISTQGLPPLPEDARLAPTC